MIRIRHLYYLKESFSICCKMWQLWARSQVLLGCVNYVTLKQDFVASPFHLPLFRAFRDVHCLSPSASSQRGYRGQLLAPGVWGSLSPWEGLFESFVWALGGGCCQWKCLGKEERATVSLLGRRYWSPFVQERSSATIDLGIPSWSVCQTEVLLPLSVPPDSHLHEKTS